MSKSVASESNEGHESREMNGKREAGDEGNGDEEGILENIGEDREISWTVAKAREERSKLATRVTFLLNVKKVGDCACCYAVNLVVVDIPEGVESIHVAAFEYCRSLNIP
ncbi:hypothetical protein TrLO_g14870 [Triparma laevis f. longispina]|uniref:Uncharacterized protein n=1 Tax=Triparma laevis f. longispina TaxID=1714387 RepID=A0A9W7L198_9STRA|nr:hypothetical protein TrLO_g14870 [Triparma laevis f. longispina]